MDQKTLKKIARIPGWLTLNEGLLLYHFAKQIDKPGAIVEIGSFQGRSTSFIASALKERGHGGVYAIDPHLGEWDSNMLHQRMRFPPTLRAFRENMRSLGLEKLVVVIRKTSEAAGKGWRKKIAFLHIDGLHTYSYIKKDLKMWLPHLVDGGVVICHDAFGEFPDVFRAVREEIFNKGSWRYLGVLDSQFFAVKGKPRNIWETFNVARSKFFLILTKCVWEETWLSERIRTFLVNRILKLFILNKFMFKEVLKLSL